MAKKTTDKLTKELKDLLAQDKIIIGTKETIKLLNEKKLSKIIISDNCPDDIYSEIEKLSKMANVPLEKVSYNNEELGTLCKKQFFISVLGIKQ